MWKWIKRVVLALLAVLALLIAYGGYQYYMIFGGGGATFDSQPPALPAELPQPAILIFSKTNAYRHDSIPAGNAALAAIARRNGWGAFVTENAAVFNPAQLARFQVVVWNNVSGEVLLPAQQAAFRAFIEQGGGFVGLHAAGDSSHTWGWYTREILGGAHFIGHPLAPQFQQAAVQVEDRLHPATHALPPRWVRTDEWYSFAKSPRPNVHVLATLDERTYSPDGSFVSGDLRMGADHPIAWCRTVGKGRVLYSALGHTEASYREAAHLRMLEGAIAWAANRVPGDCASPPAPAPAG